MPYPGAVRLSPASKNVHQVYYVLQVRAKDGDPWDDFATGYRSIPNADRKPWREYVATILWDALKHLGHVYHGRDERDFGFADEDHALTAMALVALLVGGTAERWRLVQREVSITVREYEYDVQGARLDVGKMFPNEPRA